MIRPPWSGSSGDRACYGNAPVPGRSAGVAAASVACRYCFRRHCRPEVIGAPSTGRLRGRPRALTWASVLSLDRSEPALARVPFTPPFRHNGMGHALCRGLDCFRIHRPRGWSVYGAQQAQPVASTGKSAGRRNRGIKPNLLPWVATGCRDGKEVVHALRFRERLWPTCHGGGRGGVATGSFTTDVGQPPGASVTSPGPHEGAERRPIRPWRAAWLSQIGSARGRLYMPLAW
jgi:hypothetical protein